MSPPSSAVSDRPTPALTDTPSLHSLLLEPGADPGLDRLTARACEIVGVPVSLISVPRGDELYLKSRRGWEEATSDARVALCGTVIAKGKPLVLPDLWQDEAWRDHPLAQGPTPLRFYIGLPIQDGGETIASFCACGPEPREVTPSLLERLRWLADTVHERLQLLQARAQLELQREHLQRRERFFLASRDLSARLDAEGHLRDLGPRWSEVLGFPLLRLLGSRFTEWLHPDDVPAAEEALEALASGRATDTIRSRCRADDDRWRVLEWSAVPGKGPLSHAFASVRDITAHAEAEAELAQSRQVLDAIRTAQEAFVATGGGPSWWSALLDAVLRITGSGYGFIGEVHRDAQGPYLHTQAMTDIAWNEATRALYAQGQRDGMVFRNMDTLFGAAILDDTRVIVDDAATDPRAGGVPPGHPPLRTFAALPLRDDARMVGLVGLANRPGGYDDALVESLEPLLTFAATMLRVSDLERRRREAVAEREATEALQRLVLDSADAAMIALRLDGSVAFGNAAAHRLVDVDWSPPGDDPLRARLEGWLGAGLLPARLARLPQAADSRRIEHDLSVHTIDGERRPVQLQARPIHLTDGPGLLLTLRDRTRDLQLEATQRANAHLATRVVELRRTQQENEVLGESVELLQSSIDLDEAVGVLQRFTHRLFPDAPTEVYAAVTPDGALERRYPEGHEEAGTPPLRPSDCWALRSRRVHASWPHEGRPACRHVADPSQPHVCLPVHTPERTVAVLSMQLPEHEAHAHQPDRDARRSWFEAAAQSLSGALSTVALRSTLHHLAHTDDLTELPNQRAFRPWAEKQARAAHRAGRAHVTARIDIDDFPTLVDAHGHGAGERAVRAVATVLRERTRAGDVVARLGGAAFVLAMDGLAEPVAAERLETLRQAVHEVSAVRGRPLRVSIGWIHVGPTEPAPGLDVRLQRAEDALQEARQQGGDRALQAR